MIPLKRIVLKRTCKCTVEIYSFISFELKPRPQHSDLHVVAAAKVHADVVFDPNNNSLFPKKYFVLNLTERAKNWIRQNLMTASLNLDEIVFLLSGCMDGWVVTVVEARVPKFESRIGLKVLLCKIVGK